MANRFKNVEAEFEKLKKQYRQKRISEREYKRQLKDLRLKDTDGRFWTIGAQTGKWYYFDGNTWVPSQPPSIHQKKAICVHCGFENDLENEVCAYCGESLQQKEQPCPTCGRPLDKNSLFCPDCQNKEEPDKKSWEAYDFDNGQILRSIHPVSLVLFWGAGGLFLGVVIGAFAGATDFFTDVVGILPVFLQELHGNLMGGIFYGLLGGVFGFLGLGLLGFLSAVFFNVICSFIGGIKVHMDKPSR